MGDTVMMGVVTVDVLVMMAVMCGGGGEGSADSGCIGDDGGNV